MHAAVMIPRRPFIRRLLSTKAELPFRDRRVVITGAADGIGRGTALAFARQGAHVFGVDIKSVSDEESASDATLPGSIRYHLADCGDADAVAEACSVGLSVLGGGVDVLINNVAVQLEAPCHEFTLEDWRKTMDVNVTSYFLFSKYCLPSMLAQESGAIVNIASVQGLQSQPGIPAYAASKGAVLSLTRQLSMEYAGSGIRVNSVSPGTVHTPLVDQVMKDRGSTKETMGAAYPAKRIGEVEELASAILFLAGDGASFVTGENLTVDGGIMAKGGWAEVA